MKSAKSSRDWKFRIRDILKAINKIESFVSDVSLEQFPYEEWLQIEIAISKTKIKKSHIAHLSGTIKLSEDPLQYQQNMRNEWQ